MKILILGCLVIFDGAGGVNISMGERAVGVREPLRPKLRDSHVPQSLLGFPALYQVGESAQSVGAELGAADSEPSEQWPHASGQLSSPVVPSSPSSPQRSSGLSATQSESPRGV